MVGFNNPSEVGQKQMDIQELVYYIANNQYKKDNWRIYIIKFHEEWGKQYKNNLLNFGAKHIWGKNVLVDPNKKIVDVFNESMDNRIVKFFNMNNKKFINEIEETDLIRLMYQRNFSFMNFKRIINTLFIKSDTVEYTEITEDGIMDLEKNHNTYIIEKSNRSINNIKKELGAFKEIIDYYDDTIIQLNNKINSQDNEINVLKSTIKDLEESNETKQYLDELKDIKESLKAIEDLLEKDNLL